MPALSQYLVSRSGETDGSIGGPLYIAGFVLAGVIFLGVGIFLGLKEYRKREKKRREEAKLGTVLNIRGLVREKSGSHGTGGSFSKANLDSTIPLPEKAASRADILTYHRQSGQFPRPFKPFQFALKAAAGEGPSFFGGKDDPFKSDGDPDSFPHPRLSVDTGISFQSSFSGHSPKSSLSKTGGFGRPNRHSHRASARFSVVSVSSDTETGLSSLPTSGTERKVRQTFDPVLPDELLVSQGEKLTLVQSFDDGWCIASRPSTNALQTKPSLFHKQTQEGMELGVVPAWCFLKPIKGTRVERPMRCSSLGITVNVEGARSRADVMSWSNF